MLIYIPPGVALILTVKHATDIAFSFELWDQTVKLTCFLRLRKRYANEWFWKENTTMNGNVLSKIKKHG
jgi:hypothetical protein